MNHFARHRTFAILVICKPLFRCFGWSPARGDLLSAVALAAGGGRALPDELELIASTDPGLAIRLRSIAQDLRGGRRLDKALGDAGLLDQAQQEAVRRAADVPSALDRAARQVAQPLSGQWRIEWLPLWICLSVLGSLFAVEVTLRLITGNPFETIYRELGIKLPALTEFVFGITRGFAPLVTGLLLLVLIAGGMLALRQVRGLRHLVHAWNPEVHRAAAIMRLLAHARWRGGLETLCRPWWHRPLWFASSYRDEAPAWDRDWRTWLFLTRFRLRRADRQLILALPTITERLTAIGVLPHRDGRPDFDMAEALARDRLRAALLLASPWWLLLGPMLGIPVAVIAYILPFVTITNTMGQL